MMPWFVALAGSLVTVAILMGNIIFRMGHQHARIEELERWRGDIRKDMHEISDGMEAMKIEFQRLSTVIEERARRRD